MSDSTDSGDGKRRESFHSQHFDVIDPLGGRRVDALDLIAAAGATLRLLTPASDLARTAANADAVVSCPMLNREEEVSHCP